MGTASLGSKKLLLGIEKLICPRCGRVNLMEIHTDLPQSEWLTCEFCGYKAVLDFSPILDKYGLVESMNRSEKRCFAKHLRKNLEKL